MNKAEIPFLSVTQLSELIKIREVSPVEVVEAYLDRIDGLNDQLYAYLTVCATRRCRPPENRSGHWPEVNTRALYTESPWQ